MRAVRLPHREEGLQSRVHRADGFLCRSDAGRKRGPDAGGVCCAIDDRDGRCQAEGCGVSSGR